MRDQPGRHVYRLVVFFFQAEDGIRDVAVTGVQTCALPIYIRLLVTPDRRDALAQLGKPRQPEARCLGKVSAAEKRDRKSTRLNSSHGYISYAVFCLKKKKTTYAYHSYTTTHITASETPSLS